MRNGFFVSRGDGVSVGVDTGVGLSEGGGEGVSMDSADTISTAFSISPAVITFQVYFLSGIS